MLNKIKMFFKNLFSKDLENYFKNLPTVELEDLISIEDFYKVSKFFYRTYGISISNYIRDLRFTEHGIYDTAIPYGGMYIPKFKQLTLAKPCFLSYGDVRVSYLVHELTHVLQYKRTGIKDRYLWNKTIISNILLMLTGFTGLYLKDVLEEEARANQEKYLEFIQEEI